MYVGVWEHVEEETNLWFPIELELLHRASF